jgi:hypothetical protein
MNGGIALCALAELIAFPAPARPWSSDPSKPVSVCSSPGDQQSPFAIDDGAEGAMVVWIDLSTVRGIYAQRMLRDGSRAWPASGIRLSTLGAWGDYPTIVPDGNGGAVVLFVVDAGDVYAQRIDASGNLLWGVTGALVCNAANLQYGCQLIADGNGGYIAAWDDARTANTARVYCQRLDASGARHWNVAGNGVQLCPNSSFQLELKMTTDGAGGAIVVWRDQRATNGDLYGRRIDASGTPLGSANGFGIGTTGGTTLDNPGAIISDGAGGAIVMWESSPRNRVQRITGTGTGLWGAAGIALVDPGPGIGVATSLVPDGAGGAIATWQNQVGATATDIFCQRFAPDGSSPWVSNPVTVCGAADDQYNPTAIADGAGGIIVAFFDGRAGRAYAAQRVDNTGQLLWNAPDGLILFSGPLGVTSYVSSIVPNGPGAAIFFFDNTTANARDILAMRVGTTGGGGVGGDPQLGRPEPEITSIRDVPNDQGGRVLVLWNPSDYDQPGGPGIREYTLWRRVITPFASEPLAPVSAESGHPGRRLRRVVEHRDGASIEATYWEYVATIPSRRAPGYGYTASTTADSSDAGISWNVFFVDATDAVNGQFYTSAVDSGYSVDNVAPPAPGAFVVHWFPGAAPAALAPERIATTGRATLHWSPSPAGDLREYRIHRGSTPGFEPGPGNQIASKPDTGYIDPDVAPSFYKLVAVDVHGNCSVAAAATPFEALSVEEPRGPSRPAFGTIAPQPMRDVARFSIHLPAAGPASVEIYDALGRRIRNVAGGALEAGTHAMSWDGRDDSGRPVTNGVYFLELDWCGLHATSRIVRMR